MRRPTVMIGMLVLFVLSPISLDAKKTEGGGGIIYGEDHAYQLAVPPGWIFDSESGAAAGLPVVIYPKGASWKDAQGVIYSRATSKTKGESLWTLIRSNEAALKENNPAVKISTLAQRVSTRDRRRSVIRQYTGDRHGNRELVAYIDTPRAVCMVVLTARSLHSFSAAQNVFFSVVKSFSFITDEVKSKGSR